MNFSTQRLIFLEIFLKKLIILNEHFRFLLDFILIFPDFRSPARVTFSKNFTCVINSKKSVLNNSEAAHHLSPPLTGNKYVIPRIKNIKHLLKYECLLWINFN